MHSSFRHEPADLGAKRTMRRSTDRILTTHTGSLPRPAELTDALVRRDRGELVDGDLDARIRAAVAEVVRRQVEAGVAIVNDGEASKIGYSTYVKERLEGSAARADLPRRSRTPRTSPSTSRARRAPGSRRRPPATARSPIATPTPCAATSRT